MSEEARVRPPPAGGATGYAALSALVRARGLLRPRPWSYARHAMAVFGALVAVVAVMMIWRDSWWLLLLGPAFAVVSTQIGFLGHDVGHLQVTRNLVRSRVLGLVVGNLAGGLSYGWWVRKHNAHHAHPNDLASDPDVRAGVLVWDAGQASRRRGLAAWVSRHQALLFFPFLLGEAINLHVSSVKGLFASRLRYRVAESLMLLAHFVAYVALLAVCFSWPQALVFVAIHKGIQGVYLGCAFAPNHKGMATPTVAQSRDPLLRQVLTSRNVRGGFFTDAALGGLNYQIEHHLFPSMPRANLRHAQPIVRKFCLDNQISYRECGAVASYVAALGHMHRVGRGLQQA